MNFVLRSIENIVGTGENAGYKHCLLFPTFSEGFFLKHIFSFSYNVY